jgi:hypothetical protein
VDDADLVGLLRKPLDEAGGDRGLAAAGRPGDQNVEAIGEDRGLTTA